MLVVEPERRFGLKQIIRHRWMSKWSSTIDETFAIPNIEPAVLDTVVLTHMLQLPGLTTEIIVQSVSENRFDHIYAIYNLLVDKLSKKRKEQQNLQHHANLIYSRPDAVGGGGGTFRSRKTSITTGVVERSEIIKNESMDRLSPLTSAGTSFISMTGIVDQTGELEKYIDFDLESNAIKTNGIINDHLQPQSTIHVNTRRHTVGPGDVAHEQALANPNVPINFKFGNEVGTNLPINLPMLQNQPLHNFTIKDQHLLKPPTVMGASKFYFFLIFKIFYLFFFLNLKAGTFGRRASDGGANLHIYYPTNSSNNGQHSENAYNTQNSRDCLRIGKDATEQINDLTLNSEINDESNDEIQR